MDEQRPGQIFTPQSSPNNQGGTNQAKTPDEIAQIDSAMQQQPPEAAQLNPETTPAPSPSQAQVTPANSSTEPLPSSAPMNETPPSTDNDFVAPNSSSRDEDHPLLSWRAAEPASVVSAGSRQVTLGIVAGLIVGALVFFYGGVNFSTILSMLAIVLGVVALIVANRQPSHIEEYAIYEDGINIGGRHYSFNDLKSFYLVNQGDVHTVELVPTKRFMPSLSMHLETASEEQVIDLLTQLLPHEEREPSLASRLGSRSK